jgi:hypothetical protein
MQEQLENNVVNNVVMMFAGPGGAMRRGCSQQEIDELPLKEFQLGMFPPEDAVYVDSIFYLIKIPSKFDCLLCGVSVVRFV